VIQIKLSQRQKKIIKLVKENEPITSEQIASNLSVTRAALRPDLAILTMTGILDAKPKVGYIYSKKPSYSLAYEYIRNLKVEQIMSDPVVVNEATTIYNAIVNLFLNDVGTLFVENEGVLVGAVSRKDFLKFAMGGTDMHKVPIGVIMTRMPNIIMLKKDESAYDAAVKIIDHEIDSLPVVEKENSEDKKDAYKIIGKVSKTNITNMVVNMAKNI
jgi:CBS domain-containing protein